jgi:hypothetical protein
MPTIHWRKKEMKRSKKTLILVTGIIALIAVSSLPLWAQGGRANGRNSHMNEIDVGSNMAALIENTEIGSLTENEKESILLMREEEKLARDIYLVLADAWDIPVFANIARSEAAHLAAMGMLIERYDLDDPITDSEAGQFHNPELQSLYDELTDRGRVSLEEALSVGALVEDLDIADLQHLITESDNDDIRIIYQNLLKGSRNHLRSFSRQLSRSRLDYAPQYITDADFRRITGSPNERGLISDPDWKY